MIKTTTSSKTATWVELVVLLGALTLIIWLGFARPPVAESNTHQTEAAQLLAQTSLLGHQVQGLLSKAAHYLEHAPRGYDAYFRDSVITHSHLQTDLTTLDLGMQTLIDAGTETIASRNSSPDRIENGLPLAQLQLDWKAFRDGLDEQLGVDPEMPRLEWGARHIVEAMDPVIAGIGDIREGLQAATAPTSGPGAAPPVWAWVGFSAWLVLILSWFGWRVHRNRH